MYIDYYFTLSRFLTNKTFFIELDPNIQFTIKTETKVE